MKPNSHTRGTPSAHAPAAPLVLVALALLLTGCGRGAQGDKGSATPQPSAAQSDTSANAASAPVDVAKLDAEIERLERQAERNPGDEDTRDELARVYVRRGEARRASGQLQEALADYQRALRLDPDNGDAQNDAAAVKEQLGGEQHGENGEPAPLPITPNVTDEDGKPAATPTPKKQ
ncbi:MAG TPA: tetratricopeptide repeat protein [Pyrinomonadaceae bacterium]|nr:tetratricopeptide repeat protein [Pyrinomonadaceae bacterium]